MAEIFETIMLICFGLSWPISVTKSFKSRTTKGKSFMFEVFILLGYICGVAGKFISDNVNYVLVFYFINILFVITDLILYARNLRLDKIADSKK